MMPKKTKAVKKTDEHHGWNKRRITGNAYDRTFELQKSFLIICEGRNTEPEYFNSFPLGNTTVETYGVGMSKTALIQHIISRIERDHLFMLQEVWAVFDFDRDESQLSKQKLDFDHAIALAEKNNIKVAWSNDCFELWFVLHYQLVESNLSRINYYRVLREKWDCAYQKVGKQRDFCRGIYKMLSSDNRSSQQSAIGHAQKLLDLSRHHTPANRTPATTVHILVEELNKYLN